VEAHYNKVAKLAIELASEEDTEANRPQRAYQKCARVGPQGLRWWSCSNIFYIKQGFPVTQTRCVRCVSKSNATPEQIGAQLR
jgi:hypothetical protein